MQLLTVSLSYYCKWIYFFKGFVSNSQNLLLEVSLLKKQIFLGMQAIK